MQREHKKDSLLYSLFNRSKKDDEITEEQFKEEQREIQQQIQELEAEQLRKEIPGVWEPLTPKAQDDVRSQYIKLWVSPDKMLAKAERLEFIPPKPEEKPEPTEEELQAAEREKAELAEKKEKLEQRLKDETLSTFERISAQQEFSALTAQESTDEPDEEDFTKYEWDDVFVRLALSDVGITYGIKEDAIQKLLDKAYNSEFIIAEGTLPIDGVDGIINEFFSREASPTFETRPDGSIDFKNMHLVTNVKKDTVIAELLPPTPGVAGSNVMGTAIAPRAGQAKMLTRGENTDVIKKEDAPEIQQLIAKIDGNLVWKGDKFAIENVYKVSGNVDNSTGNINFLGNVIVSGDVYEGYEIRTPGSITVFGMVEGASLYAGTDIHLEKGINGMMKGILQAGGEITAKFVENCKVSAGGNINSESIINCTVECDGDIKVIGKGLITGGKCTVFGSVEAKVIGSRSSTPTTIILGITPSIIRERNELEESYKAVCREYDEIRKNIAYLEQQKFSGDKEVNRERMLSKFNGALSIATLKKQRLEFRRDAVVEEMRNVATCTLSCATAYPPGRITIGNATHILKETKENCRFYRNSDGEISIGMR